jgi:glycosyl transferase family 1
MNGPSTDATPIPPGTLVVLGGLAAHLELDLVWAFRALGWEVAVWGNDDERAFNAATRHIELPALVLYGGHGGPLFPSLVKGRLPTAVLMHDSHRYKHARLLMSRLFDLVLVRNPGARYDSFRREHAGAELFPHAVVGQDFMQLDLDRDLDLGWVGTTDASIYARRRRLLPALASAFVMNDWRRRYPPALIPEIYGRSKIVLNISRDDWPADANTRVFEAMAAGALLVTSLPTDLTRLGFVEGVDFVGYEDEAGLFDMLRRWLDDDVGRASVAASGRTKVLSGFTYEALSKRLARLAVDEGDMFVSSRQLSESEAAAIVLEIYLMERRWSALPGRVPDLVLSAGPRVVPVAWRGLAATARRALGLPRRRELDMPFDAEA